jgi:hypothetical protein
MKGLKDNYMIGMKMTKGKQRRRRSKDKKNQRRLGEMAMDAGVE